MKKSIHVLFVHLIKCTRMFCNGKSHSLKVVASGCDIMYVFDRQKLIPPKKSTYTVITYT